MKKLVFVSLSLLLLTGVAGAERGQAMFEELNLTEQQRSEMQTLMQDHQQRMTDARELVKAETHNKMADILDEAQMQQWQDHKAEKKQRMQKRMKKMKNKRQHRKDGMSDQSKNQID